MITCRNVAKLTPGFGRPLGIGAEVELAGASARLGKYRLDSIATCGAHARAVLKLRVTCASRSKSRRRRQPENQFHKIERILGEDRGITSSRLCERTETQRNAGLVLVIYL